MHRFKKIGRKYIVLIAVSMLLTPSAVEATLEDIAEVFGISTNAVSSSIAKNRSGKHTGVKFIGVKVYG